MITFINIIVILSLISLILYVYKIRRWDFFWENCREFRPSVPTSLTGVTVIVAFRNEAENLETLLTALEKQIYPRHLYEVILVDDNSNDGSDITAKHYCERNTNFRYISNAGKYPGKKSALKTGITEASHEMVVTTDADCTMKPEWLQTISRFYTEKHPDLIVGLVYLKNGTDFFAEYQGVEFHSLVASGAGATAAGRPVYCNGANFAFRKSLFLSINDPLKDITASGDDTFLLHAVKRSGKRIMLLKSVDTIVTTQAQQSLKAFMSQRIRWVSKSRHYRDLDTLYTAWMVLSINAFSIVALLLLLLNLNVWLFPFLFTVKTTADYLFLSKFMRFYSKRLSPFRFVVFSIIYPLSVAFFALAGMISGYSWKGRYYR